MTEACRSVGVIQHGTQRDFLQHLLVNLPLIRVLHTHIQHRLLQLLRVHLVIEDAERELTQVEQRRAEVLGVDEVVDGGVRQRLTRLVVLRKSLQHGLLPRPLLHQLPITAPPNRHLRGRLHEVGLVAEGAE